MASDAPWANYPAPNYERRVRRRKKMIQALLLTWALVATGIASWMVFQPKGPSQGEIWASDAGTLERLKRDFDLMVFDTHQFLLTQDWNWTWNGLNWAALSYQTVQNAIAGPGGFPSGQSLGFNVTAMCVATYGYSVINTEAHAPGSYPYVLQSAAAQMDIYQNISVRLPYGYASNADPLRIIGLSNVSAIHSLMAGLWNVSMGVGFGQQPIISGQCGVSPG